MGGFLPGSSPADMFSRCLRSSSTLFRRTALRSISSAPINPVITVIDGDGIGPELMDSVSGVLAAADVPVTLQRFSGPEELDVDEVIISLSTNGVGLKGPLHTPVHGHTSRNLRIRRALGLFADIVPIKNIPGIETRHQDVDFVVVRENTEGEYSGLEHNVAPGVVQSLKVITRAASLRIARYAFNYAQENGRQKVTAIHKANIQKLSDGEFLHLMRVGDSNFASCTHSGKSPMEAKIVR